MIEDEVVQEVRKAREAFAASHGYDVYAMAATLHALGNASGREIIRVPQRPASAPKLESLKTEEVPILLID